MTSTRPLVIVPHDQGAPGEHPELNIVVAGWPFASPDFIEIVQGHDHWIRVPIEHARRVNAALSELLSGIASDGRERTEAGADA